MKIHTGDVVTIMTGKDKGKQGTVVRVLSLKNRVVVEGINMRTKHMKKTAQQAGQKLVYEASISASNVAVLDPKTKKPTRIGYKIDAKTGNKSRIAKLSGEVIEKKAVTKGDTEKSSTKTKSAKKTTSAKKEESLNSSPSSISSPSLPKKQPFWKRKGSEKSAESGSNDQDGGGTSFTTAHRSQGG